jgi:prevent-host-death family protein
MRQVPVTDLKNKLSHYLRLVKRGETIEVLERSVPIARLSAVSGPELDRASRLARLVKEGVIHPGGKPFLSFLETPPVHSKVNPVRALIEERGSR